MLQPTRPRRQELPLQSPIRESVALRRRYYQMVSDGAGVRPESPHQLRRGMGRLSRPTDSGGGVRPAQQPSVDPTSTR